MPIAEADAVHHQMVVQVVGVNVCSDHHLEVRKLPLGKFQTDGVNLLRRDVIVCGEGLDEVVEQCSARFAESVLGHLHLDE